LTRTCQLIHTTLIGLGHDARTVAAEQLAGATDDAVLWASNAERRVLITLDLDFADI
jgi:predicted nuclease of predicted toxin-antitoxin system